MQGNSKPKLNVREVKGKPRQIEHLVCGHQHSAPRVFELEIGLKVILLTTSNSFYYKLLRVEFDLCMNLFKFS